MINGKYGFIDSTGWIIPCEYDYAGAFQNGIVNVSKNGKYGFIDQKGKTIISFSYDGLSDIFTEGIAGAKKGNEWGFIDKQERWVVDPEYDGVGRCYLGILILKKHDKWGYVDKKTNKIQYPFTLDEARAPADNGWARIKKNGKWGFFNFKKISSINPVYDTVNKFIGNYAWVSFNRVSWIILDTNGNQVVKNLKNINITKVTPFDNGYAIAETSGGKGLLDSVGNQVIPFALKNKIIELEKNKLYIENDSGKIARLLEITSNGKIVWKTIKKYPNNFIIENGLPVTYDSITNREGEVFPCLAEARNLKMIAYRIFEFGSSYRKGYAAFTGYGTGIDDPSRPIKLVRCLPQEYEEIGFPLNQEFMPVKKDGKWGFIQWIPGKDGTEDPILAIPCKYDAVVPFFQIGNEKIAMVAKNGHAYYINNKDEVLFILSSGH